MSYIQEKDRQAVQEALENLQRPVHLALFTSEESGEYSTVAAGLLAEVAELNPQISLEVIDLDAHAERAGAYGVTQAPALVLLSGEERADNGMRFMGLPSGYEFVSLLEAIRLAGGAAELTLQPTTRAFLDELHAPMRLQVFVTPTCPHCPRAVVLAYQLAMASPHIIAEGIEVSEFPELGDRYRVMGVPKTVIDGLVHIEGAVPEPMMLARLRDALVAEAS
jgi:glutaredoxin-like protein